MVRPLPLASLCALGLLAACQTYDFEPVTPLTLAQTTQSEVVQATTLKPNLMLLVDKSGSMAFKIDSGCSGGSCPTRISELRSAMSTFLDPSTGSTTVARMGLTFFPVDDACGPSAATAVPLPAPSASDTGTDATLQATGAAILNAITTVTPNGGTPTASSLAFVSTLPGLNDTTDFRDDLVLLMTDGLPNCNGNNPNNVCIDKSATQQAACSCQTSNCLGTLCNVGCLDQDASVASVKALLARGIKTVVIGFGADTSNGAAADVLQAMAKAGGFPRTCPNGNECGAGDTCTNKTCGRSFYQASNGAELARALKAITVFTGDNCTRQLQAQPTDQRYVSVLWNGTDLQPGPDSWSYSAGGVKFVGDYCAQIKASTNANPIKIEFRIVQQF